MSATTFLTYTAAYFFVGTFLHWVLVRVNEVWNAVNYEVAEHFAEQGLGGKFIFAFLSALHLPVHLAYTIAVAVDSAVKHLKDKYGTEIVDPFAWFDIALKHIKELFGL